MFGAKIHDYFHFSVTHRKCENKPRAGMQTEKGKVVRGRNVKQIGECKLKCKERITDEDRENIFKEYRKM
jgi:hypothetical protein